MKNLAYFFTKNEKGLIIKEIIGGALFFTALYFLAYYSIKLITILN